MLQRLILEYFTEDQQTGDLYKQLQAQGYSKDEVAKTFHALRDLGYIIRTNPYGARLASFRTSETGKRLMEMEV
jgi:hypothetical protein